MTLFFPSRRGTPFTLLANLRSIPKILRFYSNSSTILNQESESTQTQFPSGNQTIRGPGYSNSEIKRSPLFSHGRAHLEGCGIELVDDEAWRVSSGLLDAFRGTNKGLEKKDLVSDEMMNQSPTGEDNNVMDFDDLDDMRIRGGLFYKIDKQSREFEEYNFEFHRKKSPKNKNNSKDREKSDSKDKQKKRDLKAKLSSGADKHRDRGNPRLDLDPERGIRRPKDVSPESTLASGVEKSIRNRRDLVSKEGIRLPRDAINEALDPWQYKVETLRGGKKMRTLTFNQVTAPYHEPFCLDIFVSKGSVRACIIHRATSSVVAVAHSISKDMKSDLSSLRNATTCAAVGEVLAQRALADDIHNVVYTPRKDERLEGKLLIVLESIMDNGVSVKVKLRKRKAKRFFRQPLG